MGEDGEWELAAVNEVVEDIDSMIAQARRAGQRLRNLSPEYRLQPTLDETIDLLQQLKARLSETD
jgi:hypothetical protein